MDEVAALLQQLEARFREKDEVIGEQMSQIAEYEEKVAGLEKAMAELLEENDQVRRDLEAAQKQLQGSAN